MDITTARLMLPHTWDEDSPEGATFREVADFHNRVRRSVYGSHALAVGPAEALALCRDTPSWQAVIHVIRSGGRLVGRSYAGLPQREGVTSVQGYWILDPDLSRAERRDAAAAALATLDAVSIAEARPWMVLQVDVEPGNLEPVSGTGGADPDAPDASVLLGSGFTLEQIYRTQLADLATMAAQLDDALAVPGYRIVTWSGRCPDEHRAAYCALAGTMGQEAPCGGIEWEPQVWDEERLAEHERWAEQAGRVIVASLALSDAGVPAGYTELYVPQGRVARQGDTLVAPAHRGHALGRHLKLASLARLRRDFPDRGFVVTENAEENAAMLAINDALGFRTVLREGLFQRKPDAVPPS